ncbi:hypothetical protein OKW35_000912 [Paraburkholderia sp. MM5477-R1]
MRTHSRCPYRGYGILVQIAEVLHVLEPYERAVATMRPYLSSTATRGRQRLFSELLLPRRTSRQPRFPEPACCTPALGRTLFFRPTHERAGNFLMAYNTVKSVARFFIQPEISTRIPFRFDLKELSPL